MAFVAPEIIGWYHYKFLFRCFKLLFQWFTAQIFGCTIQKKHCYFKANEVVYKKFSVKTGW